MDYPILSPGPLSAHLRSLRKSRGLSQTQLGAALGVGQTRIARIERDPTAVSVAQFLDVLGALGVQMVLRAGAPRTAAEGLGKVSRAASSRSATAKSRTPDEPW